MSRYDSDPQTAEAELTKASAESIRIEDDLVGARETYEQFELQWQDAKSEVDKEHLLSVMQVIENEIEGLERDLSDADDELARVNAFWFGDDV